MRGLNLASGNHADDADLATGQWVNLDLRTMAHWPRQPDVLGSVFALPFADRSFDRVYAGHVLEHLEWVSELAATGAEIRRVARPGAEVMVVGPCVLRAAATRQPASLIDAILETPWRSEEEKGIPHAWTPTTARTFYAVTHLLGLVDAVEVPITEVVLPDYPNTAVGDWQVAVRATVP